jgi:hypothetical protein
MSRALVALLFLSALAAAAPAQSAVAPDGSIFCQEDLGLAAPASPCCWRAATRSPPAAQDTSSC